MAALADKIDERTNHEERCVIMMSHTVRFLKNDEQPEISPLHLKKSLTF